ncbi:TetR/AcrR family transcriptional regulator [Nonomuraea sp. NPDC059007]|uniref:TetR/AcrR family transcriptional regulator n=1 Tax=Nonomuraea sp. NPDC059007 TaxID=3346692 RepID=UPI0036ABB2B1
MARTRDAERSGAARRATIVDSALVLFAQRGYKGTSIAAIAQAAGITQPGVLHHFRTKEALLTEVLAERDRQAFTAVGIDRAYAGPAIVRALEIVYDMVAHSRENRELTRLTHLGTAGSNDIPESALEWSRTRVRTFRTNLAGVVSKDIEAGHIRPDARPEATASLIIGMITGLEQQWLLDESFDMLVAMRAFIDTMTRDLLIPTPRD